MAQKSKSQRAKASAARAERKEAKLQSVDAVVEQPAVEAEQPKRKLFGKKEQPVQAQAAPAKAKKEDTKQKPKKKHFQFFRDVKAEMKRVTWPTKKDVIRWTGIVVVALLFFGIYVAILDNFVSTPLLLLISGLAA